jgi:CRISPR/Cas system-associated endonuclease Cas1
MKVKTLKIVLDGYGSFLGRDKGCFVIRDKKGQEKRYPLFESEIGEIQVKSGNLVSSGALVSAGFWGIDVLFLTQRGNPVAVLKSLDDDSHVKTRIAQYQATPNAKSLEIAKTLVLAKIKGQNQILKKYGLRLHDYSPIEQVKREDRLTALKGIEGRASNKYFRSIFGLIEGSLRPARRRTFKAYDGINNLFNLAYTTLSWKVHVALLNAKLEPQDIRIVKTYSNSFTKTTLAGKLKELGVDTVIVTGFCAEFCVLSTYRGAEDFDFKPIILKDSLASDNAEHLRFVEEITETISFGALKTLL